MKQLVDEYNKQQGEIYDAYIKNCNDGVVDPSHKFVGCSFGVQYDGGVAFVDPQGKLHGDFAEALKHYSPYSEYYGIIAALAHAQALEKNYDNSNKVLKASIDHNFKLLTKIAKLESETIHIKNPVQEDHPVSNAIVALHTQRRKMPFEV